MTFKIRDVLIGISLFLVCLCLFIPAIILWIFIVMPCMILQSIVNLIVRIIKNDDFGHETIEGKTRAIYGFQIVPWLINSKIVYNPFRLILRHQKCKRAYSPYGNYSLDFETVRIEII
jgi:hypothetical protein